MNIFKVISISSLISFLGAIASLSLTILLAREAQPFEYGVYLKYLSWAAIAIVLIDFASEKAFVHWALDENRGVTNALSIVVILSTWWLVFNCRKSYQSISINKNS